MRIFIIICLSFWICSLKGEVSSLQAQVDEYDYGLKGCQRKLRDVQDIASSSVSEDYESQENALEQIENY